MAVRSEILPRPAGGARIRLIAGAVSSALEPLPHPRDALDHHRP
jgi:hypothetical protein